MRFSIPLLLFVFAQFYASGQDTLRLLNGKTKIIRFDSLNVDKIFYTKQKKLNDSTWTNGKRKKVNPENVFEIALQNGERIAVYQQDTLMENYLSIEDMRTYLKGVRDAKRNYKPIRSIVAGSIVGLGSGYLGLFWGVLPAATVSGTAAVVPIQKNPKFSNPNQKENPVYYQGYMDKAQTKQRNAAGISSFVGLITSVITLQILTNNGNL